MRNIVFSAAAIAALSAAIPVLPASTAAAAVVLNGACTGDISDPTVVACIGYYGGNALSNKAADVQIQQSALAQIGYTTGNFVFSDYPKLGDLGGVFTIDFGKTLYGDTWIGVHYGNGSAPGNTTAFYHLDAGTQGVSSITLTERASSAAVLYSTDAVPEPETWAMMLGGFGLLGAISRRRATRSTVVTA
jgi:hypothetical protein